MRTRLTFEQDLTLCFGRRVGLSRRSDLPAAVQQLLWVVQPLECLSRVDLRQANDELTGGDVVVRARFVVLDERARELEPEEMRGAVSE